MYRYNVKIEVLKTGNIYYIQDIDTNENLNHNSNSKIKFFMIKKI